jgi:hypothetical protein
MPWRSCASDLTCPVISERRCSRASSVRFHDGSEARGLIGALAELLNGGHQFHRVLTQANAELLRGVGMVVCNFC